MQYVALTDILGAEDAFGDMDFKVAGTREFVTAAAARHQARRHPRRRAGRGAEQARDARLTILDVMARPSTARTR
jgi:polyribonucleotide nucleotidyltransferase